MNFSAFIYILPLPEKNLLFLTLLFLWAYKWTVNYKKKKKMFVFGSFSIRYLTSFAKPCLILTLNSYARQTLLNSQVLLDEYCCSLSMCQAVCDSFNYFFWNLWSFLIVLIFLFLILPKLVILPFPLIISLTSSSYSQGKGILSYMSKRNQCRIF